MHRFSSKALLTGFDRMRRELRAGNPGYILKSPVRMAVFILLVLRAAAIRLIPSKTTMYFIRSAFSDLARTIDRPGCSFRVWDRCSGEILRYVEDREKENKRFIREIYLNDLGRRFENGTKACTLTDGQGRIASIFFTSDRVTRVEQIRCDYSPRPGEIVITDIYTLKSHRRKGLYLLLLQHAKDYFAERGFDAFVMWIMKHNRATIRAQLRAGFTHVFQTITLRTWLGLKRVQVEGSAAPLDTL